MFTVVAVVFVSVLTKVLTFVEQTQQGLRT
jgi:hypothetical protein